MSESVSDSGPGTAPSKIKDVEMLKERYISSEKRKKGIDERRLI